MVPVGQQIPSSIHLDPPPIIEGTGHRPHNLWSAVLALRSRPFQEESGHHGAQGKDAGADSIESPALVRWYGERSGRAEEDRGVVNPGGPGTRAPPPPDPSWQPSQTVQTMVTPRTELGETTVARPRF